MTAARFCLCLLACFLTAPWAWSQTTTADGLVYTTSGSAVTITGYTGTGGAVTIPSAINGLPVTAIGDSAFTSGFALTSVTIPSSVTSIGSNAFYRCAALTGVTIPSSVISIGNDAFWNCTALASITVDASNPAYASDGKVLFNKTQTTLIQAAIKGVAGSYTIPSSVTSIGSNAFNSCTALTGVTIPSSVTSIGSNAFNSCTALTGVTIPASVSSIGLLVFYNCTALASINVDASNPTYASDGKVLVDKTQTTLIEAAPRGVLGSYTIPSGVTRIGSYAFFRCAALTDVTVPSSVTSILNAFNTCAALGAIAFLGNAPTVVSNAFVGTALTKVYYLPTATGWGATFAGIPTQAVASTGTTADGFAYSLVGTSYTVTGYTGTGGAVAIPAAINGVPVTAIGDSAFSGNTTITSVTIPSGVTSIGGKAFLSCTALTGVTIPSSVTSIGSEAFNACTALASITVDASNPAYASDGQVLFNKTQTTLIQAAPAGVSGSYTIPSSVISIGTYAFDRCTALTGVTIPTSVTSIGTYAFFSCTALTGVTIPSSVTSIGNSAFRRCTALSSITVDASNPAYASDGKVLFNKTQTTLILAAPAGFSGSFTIPSSVTSIGTYAFFSCTALTGVTIPSSVTSIGNYAFFSCTALTGVTIPSSVTSIGDYAFNRCTALTGVTIPSSVTSIGSNAFNSCTALATLAFLGNAPTEGANAFFGTALTKINYLPTATGWGATFAGIPTQAVASTGTTVDGFAYSLTGTSYTLTGYTGTGGAITIPAEISGVPVGAIGAYAFQNKSAILSVTLPGSVTSVGAWAFAGCTGLTAVTIPDTVTSVGGAVFAGCSNLTSVVLPSGLKKLQDATFLNCSKLVSVNLPVGLTDLGNDAFSGCASLVTIDLPASLTLFYNNVFQGCTALKSVVVPSSVTQIGYSVFAGCTNLAGVYFLGNAPGYFTPGPNIFTGTAVAKVFYFTGRTGWGATFADVGTQVMPDPFILTQPVSQTVSAGASASLSVVAVGGTAATYQWYKGLTAITGATASTYSLASAQLADTARYWVSVSNSAGTVKSNSAGSVFAGLGDHSFYLKADGSLWGLGVNTSGELGNGTTTNTSTAVQLAANVRTMAAGLGHTLFVDAAGFLWATGLNTVGQLGDGTTTNRTRPVRVAGDVVAVAAGNYHSLFLKSDGSLWAMGSNWNGETGPAPAGGSTPTPIATGVAAIAAGVDHSVFLKADGTVWSVGRNNLGQLGNGTTINTTIPVQVATGAAAIAAGAYHTLVLKSDGTLWGTGNNADGELANGTTTSRSTLNQFATGVGVIAAGGQHTMYVKLDGTLWTAGINSAGGLGDGTTTLRTTAVQVASNVAAIAGGPLHSLFVKQDGTLWAMGRNQVGQLGTSNPANVPTPFQMTTNVGAGAQLAILPTVTTQPQSVAVAPGASATLSVVATGTQTYQWNRNGVPISGATNASYTVTNIQLAQAGRYSATLFNSTRVATTGSAQINLTGRSWGVGLNDWGQLGDEAPLLTSTFVPVAPKVKQVSVGDNFMAFIRADNSLWAVGYNSAGQLGQGDTWSRGRPVLVGTGVASVSAGNERLYFVKLDGTLWGAGNLVQGNTPPSQIATGVRSVSAGGSHALFITVAGELWACGGNNFGQLGDGSTTRRDIPVRMATGVTSASAGANHSLFTKTDGTVWATGRNNVGQLGDTTTTDRTVAVQVAASAQSLSAGYDHSLLIKTDGSLWAWGDDAWFARKLGLASNTPVFTPTLVTQGVSAVAGGGGHTLFRKTDGSLWAMGFCYYGPLGNGSTATGPTSTGLPVKVADGVGGNIAAGGSSSAYLTDDGTLWVAGGDHWGQLGRGRLAQRADPILTGGPADVAQSSAGGSHSLIVAADGGLWATGSNVYWSTELGDGTDQSKSSPVKVADGVTSAWAGYSTSYFLKSDRSLWGMGYNSVGQLGDSTTNGRSTPRQIAAGVSSVVSGDGHMLFVTDEGKLMATGRNSTGQLGDGTTTDRLSPVEVASNVAAVAAGESHTLFLKHDGTLWGMGRNTSGELGDGSQTSRAVPVPLMTGISAIAAGVAHSLVLKQDGSLWAFGNNGGGSLGDGTFTMRTSPVQVASGVMAIAARDNNSRFLKADGSLWGMGNNWHGQLADPVSGMRTSPVLIAGSVASVSMGANHTLFVQSRITGTTPTLLTTPAAMSTALGESAAFAVTAQGPGPIAYQWMRNGVAIPGAKDPVLILPYLRSTDLGSYSVVVTNAAGSVTSNAAALSLSSPSSVAASLINGSVRATTGTGSAALLGSFTIEGSVAKQMLLRAVGPTLAGFGVTGTLADPRLEVVNSATGLIVAANDDWGAAPNVSQATQVATQVGAFALTAGGKDAMILGSFGPGTYRVRVLGAGTSTGTCLLEVYDADTTPRLVQLATRGPVGGTAGALIQGFVAKNVPAGRSYLIRALGPSLGLAGALGDPTLALFSGSTALATNDNWAGDTALAAAATTAGAMPLPAASKDAALLFTPTTASGAYTLQVSGVGSASGLALLEIFEVDAQRPASFAPALLSPPEDVAIAAGQPITLGVVATGKPAPTFQWRKDGAALSGATNASHVIATASATDAGGYEVVVTNTVATVTSPVASVIVSGGHSATHAVVGGGYIAGSTVTITNTLTYTGTASSLGWLVTLPAGWSFVSAAGSIGDVKPPAGTLGTLEWAWSTVPASPVTFTYTVNVPAGETLARTLAATGIVRAGGTVTTLTATASPLALSPITTHSADTNSDFKLSLFELTRVIELYNTRNGSSRTGCYAVATTATEDGFAIDATRLSTATVTLARYHAGDSNRDGKLSLFELTRVIELYNVRAGATRTGAYHAQGGTEDGFAPGP